MWSAWIETGEEIGSRGTERTLRRGDFVAKVLNSPQTSGLHGRTSDPSPRWQLPRSESAVPWAGFGYAGPNQLVAVRPWVEGATLSSEASNLDVAYDVVAAVRDLHDQGIVHGDLQPRNIVVGPSGVRLIDIALVPFTARGEVVGSAGYMAPEIWESQPPTRSSDRYALAALLSEFLSGRPVFAADDLAGFARAHQAGAGQIKGIEDEVLRGVLTRMLSVDPEKRPGLQALLDALVAAGGTPTTTRVWFWPEAMAATTRTLVDGLESARALSLTASTSQGRASIVDEVVDRAELAGYLVVAMRRREVLRPATAESNEGPWSPALAVVEAAHALVGLPVPSLSLRHGDRLHVLESLTSALREAVAVRPIVLVWDDVAATGPDVSAWWNHLFDVQLRDSGLATSLTLLHAGDSAIGGIEVVAPRLEPSTWRRFRARTLRADVQDIPDGRFEELLESHGEDWRAMLDALDREVGARLTTSHSPSRWDTAQITRVGDSWRDSANELLEERAFGAAIELCRGLWAAIRTRDSVSDSMRMDVLSVWTDAVLRGGLREPDVEVLEASLRDVVHLRTQIMLARLMYALGRHRDGLESLEDAPPSAERNAWRAQLLLSSGQFEEAESTAVAGLQLAHDEPTRLHLELMALAGRAIRGDATAIEQLRDLGPQLDVEGVSASLRARAHAYRAIGLNRRDELDDATDAYIRALEEIESAGLDAEMPTYLLNVGTAYHRQGRLGLAREYYARGVRLSQPTTRASTRGLLLINQANIDIALGRLDESTTLLDRARAVGERHDLRQILVVCRQLEGDISLERGQPEAALRTWRETLSSEEMSLTPREQSELQLSIAEAHIALENEREAGAALERARRIMEENRVTDFEHHLGILRARLQWTEGSSLGTMAGIELFRRSLLGAQGAGNHRLVLRQAPYLLRQLANEGLEELEREVAELVQSSRNAIAMGLTRELRADFFAQLPEQSQRPLGGTSSTKSAQPSVVRTSNVEVERFYRMLSLNEMILSSASLGDLLDTALEIALSLSGAERGFVLLRAPDEGRIGEFRVESSRDVDGSQIPQPHLEVSLTIAQEAARTGRTVTTINAREDRRFNQALSVVDLDLTSVVCVPVRDGSGLLGALYLDHRYQPGVFEGDLPRMMEAFAHQVALAITNTRRLEKLESESERLAQANAQLDALLLEREAEVEGLARRVASLSEEVDRQFGGLREAFPQIAFTSSVMERLLDQVRRVARGDVPVVVTGESGVGKELVASAIHQASPRKDGPFVALNCGAVSESLFESEMFGHVRGAFTGADIDRKGLFVAAHGGTFFLDEIGEMPMSMQVKLLRVLQERTVRRVGSTEVEQVDVRVVAATNRDLRAMVAEGTFREDLFYRLAAIVLEVPPLRDRREDIPLIAQAILDQIDSDRRISPDAARLLRRAEWKGNVRELENTLRAANVLSDTPTIDVATFAPLVRLDADQSKGVRNQTTESRGRRRKASREDVVEALRRSGEDRDQAAEMLGVSTRTLYRYLKRWDLG